MWISINNVRLTPLSRCLKKNESGEKKESVNKIILLLEEAKQEQPINLFRVFHGNEFFRRGNVKKRSKLKVFGLLLLLSFNAIGLHAQTYDWRAPPLPQWCANLSEADQNMLIDMAFSYTITHGFFLTIPTADMRQMIDRHGLIWKSADGDVNAVTIGMRDSTTGRYYWFFISRYWLQ